MVLNAAQFREAAAKRRKTKDVEVPGVGLVRLRAISAGAAHAFQQLVKQTQAAGGDVEGLAFTLIAQSWVGEDNELLMPEEEGVEFARSLDQETFTALGTATLELNGLTEAAVEEAVKNSVASRKGDSSTGSRETSDTPV